MPRYLNDNAAFFKTLVEKRGGKSDKFENDLIEFKS